MGFIWDDKKDDDDKFKSHLETKIEEATTTLSNTNGGLLSDIVKLKKTVKEKEGVEVDEFNRLKNENEQLKNKQQEGETEAEKQLRLSREQHKTDLKALQDEVKDMKDSDKKNIVNSKVSDAITEIGVKPSMVKAAKKIISSDVTFEDGKPMIGDKTIMDFAKAWASTEEGKNFVLAKKNSGGNSNGGGSDDEGEHDKYFDPKSGHKNITKQTLLKKSNPDLYKELKDKYK